MAVSPNDLDVVQVRVFVGVGVTFIVFKGIFVQNLESLSMDPSNNDFFHVFLGEFFFRYVNLLQGVLGIILNRKKIIEGVIFVIIVVGIVIIVVGIVIVGIIQVVIDIIIRLIVITCLGFGRNTGIAFFMRRANFLCCIFLLTILDFIFFMRFGALLRKAE